MLDLRKINDDNFECLCKDILEKKLNTKLRTYRKGKDGGIDVSCFTVGKRKIVLQAKHYINSKYSDLYKTLKNTEVDNVERLKPDKYYVYTSLELTPKQLGNIHSLFSKYMEDTSYIVTAIEINAFLRQKENIDIVKRYFQLSIEEIEIFHLMMDQNKQVLSVSDFGINKSHIDLYNKDEYYEKKIFIVNEIDNNQNTYSTIFDLVYNNFSNREYRHYLISADAGMGKSYEMKKAVVILYNKAKDNLDKKEKEKIVQAYFYDLKNFHNKDNPPWEKAYPHSSSETFCVFLDGLDELSESNQVLLRKMIGEELANRESTYFVISGRTSSFNDTGIESIFNDKNKINCHISTPEKLLDIPFYRNIVDELGIKDSISLLDLMEKLYKNEFEKFLVKNDVVGKNTDKKYYKRLVNVIGNFVHKQFIREDNSWNNEYIDYFIEDISEDDNFINDLEFFIKHAGWISVHKTKENEIEYSFSHKIHQEYLIASNLVQSVKNEIPKVFLAGKHGQIIKDKYSNIFALWLQLQQSQNYDTSKIINKAIELLITKENIEVVFMCDVANLGSQNSCLIFKYIIENLMELPFLGWQSKEIASIFSKCDEENKNELINILIEEINENIKSDTFRGRKNDYFSTYITILEYVVNNYHTLINVNEIKDILKSIINTIEEPNDKYKKYKNIKYSKYSIFKLNDIIKNQYAEDFNVYNYIDKNIKIDDEYKEDFKVCQIMHDFTHYYHSNTSEDTIKKYHKELLSIIVVLETKYSYLRGGFFTTPNEITDEYAEPEPISLHSPALYLKLFLEQFLEQKNTFNNDKKTLEEIPSSLRTFILEAIKLLIDKCEENELLAVKQYDIFGMMLSILIRMSNNLAEEENEKLQDIFLSEKLVSSCHVYNRIPSIIENIPNEYKKDWFNKFAGILEKENKVFLNTVSIESILFTIIQNKENNDGDLDCYLQLIKKKCKEGIYGFENMYKHALVILKKKDTELFKKYSDDYNYFLGSFDELNKKREELLDNLKKTAEDNISKEINCLFDKNIFKRDGLEIFEIMESIDMDNIKYQMLPQIYNCSYSNIEQHIKYHVNDIENIKKFDFIDKYPNQIIVNFLMKFNNISKSYFGKWIETPEWDYYRFTIIVNYIADSVESFLHQNKKNTYGIENKESYLESDNNTLKLPYETELVNRIDGIKRELSKNINNIHPSVKLDLYIWFKKEKKFDIELTDDDIYNFIQCRNEINSNSISENIFYHLEYLLGTDKKIKIIEACAKYINYVAENKESTITDMNFEFSISFIITYLKINYDKIIDCGNIDSINDKIIDIFVYGLKKSKTYLCQEILWYLENKELENKIDGLLTKDDILSLSKDVYYSFFDRLLVYNTFKNKISLFPNIHKILKAIFNELGDEDDLKYTISLIILNNNSDVLSWLVKYFVELDGTIKNNDYFESRRESMLFNYSFNDDAIGILLKLLKYAHEKNPILERRKILSSLALSWLYNSSNKDNFYNIKTIIEQLMQNSDNLKNYINHDRWLIRLEEKVFNGE